MAPLLSFIGVSVLQVAETILQKLCHSYPHDVRVLLLLYRQPVIRQNGCAILLHTYCEQFEEIERSFCAKSRHIKPPGSTKSHVEATFFGVALQKQDMPVNHISLETETSRTHAASPLITN